MKLNYTQVIGLNTDQKASQTNFTKQDEENAFAAVLKLTSDDAFTKGRQTLTELSDFYFEFEGSPAQKLIATFSEAEKKFSGCEYELVLSAISGKVLYLVSQGDFEVLLKRADSVSDLLSLGSPKQLISGFLNEGDKVLFSTKTLSQILGEGFTKSLDLSLEEFEQDLSDRIGTLDSESGKLAALLIETQVVIQSEIRSQSEKEESESINIKQKGDQIKKKTSLKPYLEKLTLLTNIFTSILQKFPKSGRGRLIIVGILIIIIGIGVGLKYIDAQNSEKDLLFNSSLTQARDDFNTAKSLQSLNSQGAKSKLESAKGNIDKALAIKPNDSGAKSLKEQIKGESGSILKQFQTQDFPEFLDLNLIKKDFKVEDVGLSQGKLLLLDSSSKTLVTLDIESKSNKILAGQEQLGDVLLAAHSDNFAYVYSKDKGILRIDMTNQKVITVSKIDNGWGKIGSLMPFASNVYLLDKTSDQIWKYIPTSDGYSSKREYLTLETKVDFADALNMQIDSSIYVLKSNGEILKFNRGNKESFSYGGLDKAVKDPKSFFVSEDTKDLYVLDSGNSRLLVLTKQGSYKSQIAGEKFAQATDLAVDEKGGKVYLLEGSKIYSVDLK